MKTKTPQPPKKKLGPLETALRENRMPTLDGRAIGIPSQISRLTGIAESSICNAIATGKIRQYRLPGGHTVTDLAELCTYFQNAKPGRKKILAEPVAKPAIFKLLKDRLRSLVSHVAQDIG